MSLCLREGNDPQLAIVRRLLWRENTIAPQMWMAEVRNGLVVGERRGRISPAEVDAWFRILERSPITIDVNPDHLTKLALARTHGLTFYDALYLELAQRRQATLATLDHEILRAAQAEGVPTLDG